MPVPTKYGAWIQPAPIWGAYLNGALYWGNVQSEDQIGPRLAPIDTWETPPTFSSGGLAGTAAQRRAYGQGYFGPDPGVHFHGENAHRQLPTLVVDITDMLADPASYMPPVIPALPPGALAYQSEFVGGSPIRIRLRAGATYDVDWEWWDDDPVPAVPPMLSELWQARRLATHNYLTGAPVAGGDIGSPVRTDYVSAAEAQASSLLGSFRAFPGDVDVIGSVRSGGVVNPNHYVPGESYSDDFVSDVLGGFPWRAIQFFQDLHGGVGMRAPAHWAVDTGAAYCQHTGWSSDPDAGEDSILLYNVPGLAFGDITTTFRTVPDGTKAGVVVMVALSDADLSAEYYFASAAGELLHVTRNADGSVASLPTLATYDSFAAGDQMTVQYRQGRIAVLKNGVEAGRAEASSSEPVFPSGQLCGLHGNSAAAALYEDFDQEALGLSTVIYQSNSSTPVPSSPWITDIAEIDVAEMDDFGTRVGLILAPASWVAGDPVETVALNESQSYLLELGSIEVGFYYTPPRYRFIYPDLPNLVTAGGAERSRFLPQVA
jgi:hypothetical protein